MTRASVQRLAKGDIIVERVNGKNRMIPVKQVEFNACSTRGVHVNRNMCYGPMDVVDLVEGEGTLGDLEKAASGLGDLEEDFDPEVVVDLSELDTLEAWVDKLVKQ
jgi:hypothetical protein